ENKGTQLHGIFVQMDDPSGMSVAATAEQGRFLSTDDPNTITFRLNKVRMVQESPKFPTPRTGDFGLYDLPVKLPAIDQFRRRGGATSDSSTCTSCGGSATAAALPTRVRSWR